MAGGQAEGGRPPRKILGQLRVVYIQPDTDDQKVYPVQVRLDSLETVQKHRHGDQGAPLLWDTRFKRELW